ncbi:MAG: stage III sporulation protein AF [Ruminococcus sp.]
MTESIYICAGSLCVCLVACALLRMISPSGSTKKIMSVVVGVFMLCCLLSPIVSLMKSFDVSDLEAKYSQSESDLSQTVDAEVLKATGDYINEYTSALLREAKIDVRDIKTVIGQTETRGIYVREIYIYIDNTAKDKEKAISELILSAVGIEPKINCI